MASDHITALPNNSGFYRLSTKSKPARKRFDFWRDMHSEIGVDFERAGKRSSENFSAELLFSPSQDGCVFGHETLDDINVSVRTDHDGFVFFSTAVAGAVKLDPRDGREQIVTARHGLTVLDGLHPHRASTIDHSQVFVSLPGTVAESILSGMPRSIKNGVVVLPPTGLARFLISHLHLLASSCEHLDALSTQLAMKMARDLACGILEQIGQTEKFDEAGSAADAIHVAAERYIDVNIANRDLCAEAVANAVGCSRAQLYRVFAAREQSVGEMIRAARMKRASALLRMSPPIALKRIAHLSGYASVGSFTRGFRQHTGLTPLQFREAAVE